MRAYLIRRLLLVIPTLFILSILVFLSVRFIPGDVIDVMQGRLGGIGGVDREALEQMLGLDQPVYVQYGRWLGDILLHGNLGRSLMGDWAVEERIIGRLPVTIELGVMAIVIGLLIALPVGIYSAIRQDTAADYVGRSVAILGLATPNFWLAIMVVLYPSLWWRWTPPIEWVPFSEGGNVMVNEVNAGATHDWATMDLEAALDWLAPNSLPPHPTLIRNNRWLHALVTDGVEIEYQELNSGETRGGRARLVVRRR